MQQDPLKTAIILKQKLKKKIYGQNLAIEAVVDSIKNKVIKEDSRPQQIYFFVGPPATGKTFMAQEIAKAFDEYEYFEVTMSDYQTHNSGQALFGTERGYNSEQNGMLTNQVKKHPKTVILIDEFEKAHTVVQRKFLSMLSAGYVEDALGWIGDEPFNSSASDSIDDIVSKVDFTQTIVIFTSNLGSALYNNQDFLDTLSGDYHQAESMLLQEIAKETKLEADEEILAIVPEMLSRLSQGNIVLFKKLQMNALRKIAVDTFNFKIKELALSNNLKIVYKDGGGIYFIQVQLLRFAPEIDVRRLKAKIYELFTDTITDFLLEKGKFWSDIRVIEIGVSDEVVTFTKEQLLPDMKKGNLLKELFRKNKTLELQESVTLKDKTVFYTIESVAFKKITKVADTLGDGAIKFQVPTTTFDDIAGHQETKERLKEIATFLKEPELLKKFGAKIPKGMLLYGVPGTGKTMLARAFANYADIPFIATTANELIGFDTNNYATMKKIFKRAKEYAPSIIFIDEIDTFGNRIEQKSPATINEFLTHVDGFSQNIDEAIFIIAATNHKQNIDDAILRSGRIELHVEVPPLDKEGREVFIKKILEKPSQKDIDLDKLVSYTTGLTGADLEKIGNEAALYTIRNNIPEISQTILIEQINIQKYGKRVTNKTPEDELKEVAYHEAGHAVIAKVLMPEIKIEQVTIVPRENAQGFVTFSMENEITSLSKEEFMFHIVISLAGRVAQMYKFKESGQDTGARSDLQKATQDAYAMIKTYGMDNEFENLSLDDVELSEKTKELIDMKVVKLVDTLTKQTQELVREHFNAIEKVAKELIKKEVLYGDELVELLQ